MITHDPEADLTSYLSLYESKFQMFLLKCLIGIGMQAADTLDSLAWTLSANLSMEPPPPPEAAIVDRTGESQWVRR